MYVLLCTLGDVLLDVIVRLEQPLARGDDARASARAGAGGQAANVAAWAVELGAQGRIVGKRGDDEAALLVERELLAHGVELVGPTVAAAGGIVVSLVDPDGERSMLSDRGVSPTLRAEELDVAWFRGCDALHLSGYALLARPIDEAGAKAAGAVRAQGGTISVVTLLLAGRTSSFCGVAPAAVAVPLPPGVTKIVLAGGGATAWLELELLLLLLLELEDDPHGSIATV